MKGIYLGFHPDSGHPKLPTLDPNHEFLPLVDVLLGSDFQFESSYFQRAFLVLEKYQCPTFTGKPATCGSRPDLKPKRKRFKTVPNKDLKKKTTFADKCFIHFFVWTNLKKRDTKKQSPLLSHLHHLPLVNGEPLTLRVFEDQKDHRWMPFSSWTALPNGKPLRFLVAEFPLFPVVKIFLQRKMQHDDGSKLREYCMFGRYIYRGYL